MSFFSTAKNKNTPAQNSAPLKRVGQTSAPIAQLNVDMFQADGAVIIYAQAAGADYSDIKVSIEGSADIVLIEGRRDRPEPAVFLGEESEGDWLTEECVWGDFYRKIILPESVDVEQSKAKVKNGLLVLTLPILGNKKQANSKLKITHLSGH